MAKYNEPFEDIQKLFEEIIGDRGLDHMINIKVLTDNNQKKIGKVVKANPLMKHMTGEDVIVIINEDVFERLDDVSQYILAENILTSVTFNGERDKVEIVEPTVQTYKGVIEKHSIDSFLRANELVELTYQQLKEEKAEANA